MSSISDGQVKQSDIIRIPLVFHTPADMLTNIDSGALIMLTTIGKVTGNANNGAYITTEEISFNGPSKDPIIRASTNGISSFFLFFTAGYYNSCNF